jgi:hypothetical protein
VKDRTSLRRFANGAFNPLPNDGGSLRQLKTLGNSSAAPEECVAFEKNRRVPRYATSDV